MRRFPRYLLLPIITTGVVVIAISVFYYVDSKRVNSLQKKVKDTRKSDIVLNTDTNEISVPDPQNSMDFVYPIENTRDPFQQMSIPVIAQNITEFETRQSSILLTGIIWDTENPIAILSDSKNNSYLVKIGEEINGTKVLSIGQKSVILKKNGEERELELWQAKL